jgi:NAD(P)-dependent dehydrogenase (short-subunit alcohol dehydrogenase family)
VAICGRDAARLDAARAALGSERLLALRCDVLQKNQFTAFAARVAEWGGGTLDLLVNNAGQGRVSTVGETTDEAWRE